MSSRHARRKAAKARQQRKLEGLAQAQRSANIAAIVRKNMAAPPERNYWASQPSNPSAQASASATQPMKFFR